MDETHAQALTDGTRAVRAATAAMVTKHQQELNVQAQRHQESLARAQQLVETREQDVAQLTTRAFSDADRKDKALLTLNLKLKAMEGTVLASKTSLAAEQKLRCSLAKANEELKQQVKQAEIELNDAHIKHSLEESKVKEDHARQRAASETTVQRLEAQLQEAKRIEHEMKKTTTRLQQERVRSRKKLLLLPQQGSTDSRQEDDVTAGKPLKTSVVHTKTSLSLADPATAINTPAPATTTTASAGAVPLRKARAPSRFSKLTLNFDKTKYNK
jgi:hypothetical protein